MTTTETLAALQAQNLDPQTHNMGMSGWICWLDVNNEIKSFDGGTEAEAVEKAWKWVQANPIEGDDWGAS